MDRWDIFIIPQLLVLRMIWKVILRRGPFYWLSWRITWIIPKKKKKKTKKKGLYALIKQVVPLIVEPVIYWTIESTRKRFYRKPTCYPKITKLSHLLSYDWRVHITRSQSVRIFITTTMFFRISGYILNWM